MQTASELRDFYRDEVTKQLVRAAIEQTTTNYFEGIKRRWKDENDAVRAAKKGVSTKQSRREARARGYVKSLAIKLVSAKMKLTVIQKTCQTGGSPGGK
jgi:hypothetical protein